jgi:hypothetical protein
MYCLHAGKINSLCLVLYLEVSEGSEQVQQIETTAVTLSVRVVLGGGRGLGAHSEVKSGKRRGERSRRLNCRHYRSGRAIQPCPIVGVKTPFHQRFSVGVMA